MKYISTVFWSMFLTVVAIILAAVIFTPKCRHEEVRAVYSFRSRSVISYKDTGHIKWYCKDCDYYLGIDYLYGTPADKPYLDPLREYSGENELVDGEYYTMKAVVTSDIFDNSHQRIYAKVQNENVTLAFTIAFREGYEEELKSLQAGDEITFRGKFEAVGYDWTDCELIK